MWQSLRLNSSVPCRLVPRCAVAFKENHRPQELRVPHVEAGGVPGVPSGSCKNYKHRCTALNKVWLNREAFVLGWLLQKFLLWKKCIECVRPLNSLTDDKNMKQLFQMKRKWIFSVSCGCSGAAAAAATQESDTAPAFLFCKWSSLSLKAP